jgi:fatty acid desaturase
VSYEAKVRTQRAEAKKAAMKAREKRNEQIAMAIAIAVAFFTCIAGLYYVGEYMGKW